MLTLILIFSLYAYLLVSTHRLLIKESTQNKNAGWNNYKFF